MPDIGDLEGVILLDDLAVDVWDEEQGRKEEQPEANAESNTGNVPGRLLVETEIWGTLVYDGQCANGTGNQEEERRSENGPLDGVFASVNSLDVVSKLRPARESRGH